MKTLGLLTCVLGASVALACGGDAEVVANPDPFGDGGPDATGGSGGSGEGGSGATIFGGNGGMGGTAGSGGSTTDPCDGVVCDPGQRCEPDTDGGSGCVANTCDDLDCTETEECVTTANGAICEDISCGQDVDCPPERFCDTTDGVCKDDTCAPGERTCSGDDVLECDSNGGGESVVVSCSSPTAFVSECVSIDGETGCSCEDDWDCPDFQECEAGVCIGTGVAPTCSLPPVDFTSVLPSIEIKWGGENESDLDVKLRELDGVPLTNEPDSPWPASGQVVMTPLVANLDDDNGDGRIDERDFPEIIFLTFCDSGDATANGILRALHGGGVDDQGTSKKGRDYLAVCGTNRFLEGTYFDGSDMPLGSEPNCGCDDPDIDSTSTLAVGDLDFDGVPEIIAFLEHTPDDGNTDFAKREGAFAVYDNEGRRLLRFPATGSIDFGESNAAHNTSPSIANVVESADPAEDVAEILLGRDLFVLDKDDMGNWSVSQRLTGQGERGINSQGPVPCIADLVPERNGMEMIAGATVYGIPLDGTGNLDTSATQLVTLAQDGNRDGFCAIADVWGADDGQSPSPANPLDGSPELVLISNGNLFVYTLDITTDGGGAFQSLTLNEVSGGRALPGANGGGAPNVDDFDGDGFPEIGTAGRTGYIMLDLQDAAGGCPEWTSFADDQNTNPRSVPNITCSQDSDCSDLQAGTACNENLPTPACVCLHNSWRRATQDDSSRVTGSSVFDFNGDGAAEVIYNDECNFRIYNGLDGTEIEVEPSESRTRIEYPIVADVDNDGNAEIVFSTSNESGFCTNRGISCTVDSDCPSGNDPDGQKCIGNRCEMADRAVFNNGIEVWGDLGDRWVSARRVWNQHAYHVTNITEASGIPRVEPSSWLPLGNRFYNTYRSQPRSFGVAPDLTVTAVQVSSPDAACGSLSTTISIGVQITNEGDLRVGPGVSVVFEGTWGATTELLRDAMGGTLTFTLTNSLEPKESLFFQVEYQASYNGQTELPDSIRVIVDPASQTNPDGVERECIEDNNDLTVPVEPGEDLPDLTVSLEDPSGCPVPTVSGEVCNDGTLPASDILVRIYAGDPEAGGTALGEVTVPGPLAPGACQSFTTNITDFPTNRSIRFFAVVDPDNTIEECDDADNKFGPTAALLCSGVQ